MKATLHQKAEILQRFASGEIDLQELKASHLGIGLGEVHFHLKGFEPQGCLDPVQIDELITPGEGGILAPCMDAFFYTPRPGGVIIVFGQKIPDMDLLLNAPRKPSIMAHLSVMENLGTRSPAGSTPEEEAARNQKIELEIMEKRKSLRNL